MDRTRRDHRPLECGRGRGHRRQDSCGQVGGGAGYKSEQTLACAEKEALTVHFKTAVRLTENSRKRGCFLSDGVAANYGFVPKILFSAIKTNGRYYSLVFACVQGKSVSYARQTVVKTKREMIRDEEITIRR